MLLKQDKFEAENTVKGRLDYITGEMYVTLNFVWIVANIRSTRLEDQIKESQQKLEKKKAEIIQIQSAAQQGSKGQEA